MINGRPRPSRAHARRHPPGAPDHEETLPSCGMSSALTAMVRRQVRAPGPSHARGASKPVIFLSGRSGLGNRLRALLGYRALSLCCGVPFLVCWVPNPACDAEFDDLFEPPPFPVIDLLTCGRLLAAREAEAFTVAR